MRMRIAARSLHPHHWFVSTSMAFLFLAGSATAQGARFLPMPPTYASGGVPQKVVVADINKDGYADLVVSAGFVEPARAPALGVAERGARAARRVRPALSSRVYLPACVIAVVAGVLLAVGWATAWGGSDFAGSPASLSADRPPPSPAAPTAASTSRCPTNPSPPEELSGGKNEWESRKGR